MNKIIITLLVLLGVGYGVTVYAGEVIETTSPWVTQESQLQLPVKQLEENGKIYKLIGSEKQENLLSNRIQLEQCEIEVEALEFVEDIPSTIRTVITDDITKELVTVVLPLKEYEITQEYWTENFYFPITVKEYDADEFLLGTLKVPNTVDLNEYKIELLHMMGLSSKSYEIKQITWDTEAFISDGIWVRTATARGRKMVKDMTVTYEGEVELEDVTVISYKNTYAMETFIPEIQQKKEVEPTVLEELVAYLKEHMAVFISIWVILLLIIIFILGKKKLP